MVKGKILKNIGMILIAIVLAVFGMNQWESYKINKTANDGIEAMQKVMKSSFDKKKESASVNSDIAMINSALSTTKQMRLLKGNSLPIIDLNQGGRVFSTIDIHVKDCQVDNLSSQCWKTNGGSMYTYITAKGDEILFMYSTSSNRLSKM